MSNFFWNLFSKKIEFQTWHLEKIYTWTRLWTPFLWWSFFLWWLFLWQDCAFFFAGSVCKVWLKCPSSIIVCFTSFFSTKNIRLYYGDETSIALPIHFQGSSHKWHFETQFYHFVSKFYNHVYFHYKKYINLNCILWLQFSEISVIQFSFCRKTNQFMFWCKFWVNSHNSWIKVYHL